MLTKNLKDLLLKRNDHSDLNFTMLIEMLGMSKYEFIGCRLRGVMGLGTHKKAYFDMDRLSAEDNQLIFFVILHEYCHVLAIERMGKETMISQLSEKDFDVFFNHIVGEEILADRFASYYFYQYNKKQYPRYRTQQLEDETIKIKYIDKILGVYGQIKDEETYDKLIDYFIVG